ncbi:hypothetical protein MTO96_013582 [Rhipicephalus appendiculatus]
MRRAAITDRPAEPAAAVSRVQGPFFIWPVSGSCAGANPQSSATAHGQGQSAHQLNDGITRGSRGLYVNGTSWLSATYYLINSFTAAVRQSGQTFRKYESTDVLAPRKREPNARSIDRITGCSSPRSGTALG